MSDNKEKDFLNQISDNQGIMHKVCRIYFEHSQDREDVFQEMMIHLWKSYDSFRGASKFSTWMYRVCLNVALQYFNKRKKREQNSAVESEIQTELLETEYDHEQEEVLYKAIGKLNRVEKAIMLLHLEENSNSEIAEIIGITQNNVRVRMNRIKVKLRTILKPMINGN